jgi:hypothetical protein
MQHTAYSCREVMARRRSALRTCANFDSFTLAWSCCIAFLPFTVSFSTYQTANTG